MKFIPTGTPSQTISLILCVGIIFAISEITYGSSTESDVLARVMRIRAQCSKAANLTDAEYKLILDHELFTPQTKTETTSKRLQCYCLCYMKETEIMIDNKPNMQKLESTLHIIINSKKKAEAAIAKCTKLTGADDCERGFNFELCLIQETGLYI